MDKKISIKILAVFVVVIIIGVSAVALLLNKETAGDPNDDGPSYTVYRDMASRNVTDLVEMNVQHIVASGVGALRFVSYLDSADLVVAVEPRENTAYNSKSYVYAYGYDNTTVYNRSIGSGGDGLIGYSEKLSQLATPPEVIVYSVPSATLTADRLKNIDDVEALGMRVVVILELNTMLNNDGSGLSATFVKQTSLLGHVLNKTQRASELMEYMNSTIADLRTRMNGVSAADKQVSAYIGSLSYSGAKGFDFTSSSYDPFTILGVNNVITGGAEVVYQVNMDSILLADPDYIFLDPTGYATFMADWDNGDSPRSSSTLNALSAFENGDVYMTMPFIWYGVNFDNVLLGAYYIGSVLYPSAFSDVDISGKAADIFTHFVGEDCYGDMNAWFENGRNTAITGPAGVLS